MLQQLSSSLNEGEPSMPEQLYPCYGGPHDGCFYPMKKCPQEYKEFLVRGRKVLLYKKIKPERLDFTTLARASRIMPSAFDTLSDEDSEEECKTKLNDSIPNPFNPFPYQNP